VFQLKPLGSRGHYRRHALPAGEKAHDGSLGEACVQCISEEHRLIPNEGKRSLMSPFGQGMRVRDWKS
jgi:hypothetical protein